MTSQYKISAIPLIEVMIANYIYSSQYIEGLVMMHMVPFSFRSSRCHPRQIPPHQQRVVAEASAHSSLGHGGGSSSCCPWH